MCDYLDNFDFNSVDSTTLSNIIRSARNFIGKAVASLALPRPTPVTPSGTVYTEDFLEDSLVKQLKCDLSKLMYLSTGVKQPGVCLFGQHRYAYNKATANLEPIPFGTVSSIDTTLEAINTKLGTDYNSVLVNKYHNKNTALNWHSDNEPEIDQTHPIATLSIGAKRRLLVADNRNDGEAGHFSTVSLTQNSVLTMEAGFQSSHVHKVDSGKTTAERGIRYSITLRRMFPVNIKKHHEPQPTSTPHRTIDNDVTLNTEHSRHSDCYTSIVIGSSLVKGLDAKKLSKPGRCFKVICHPGAKSGQSSKKL